MARPVWWCLTMWTKIYGTSEPENRAIPTTRTRKCEKVEVKTNIKWKNQTWTENKQKRERIKTARQNLQMWSFFKVGCANSTWYTQWWIRGSSMHIQLEALLSEYCSSKGCMYIWVYSKAQKKLFDEKGLNSRNHLQVLIAKVRRILIDYS